MRPIHRPQVLLILAATVALGAGCRGRTEKRDPFKVPGAQPLNDALVARDADAFTPRDSFLFLPASPSTLRFFWKDSSGKILGSLGAVKRMVEARGGHLRFAMNGGMYTEDQGPLGLLIQDGKTIHRLNRDTGYGNFYLRPNGVFFVTEKGEVGVCTTQDFPSKKGVRFATQSGPMLLIDGQPHPAFKDSSVNLNIRNGVGIRPDGSALLGISRVPVNFWDFAQAFRRKGCENALYLDGAVSRLYWPTGGWKDTGGAFGVIIGVVDGK